MYVLGVLRIIVEFVIGVIMLPVLLIFKLLSNLLGGGNGNDNPGESQPINPVETPAPIGIQNPSLPWWDVVRSSLFWAIFFIIIGIATYQYIQQNRVLFSALKSLSLWRWLMQAWHWLKVKVKVVRCGLASAVKDGLVKINAIRSKPVQKSEWRIANPYRMTPRQQIIFFYLALARRGREAGFPRHASQTPYEYAQFITYELADERDALIELTEGFIDARYSLHDVTPEKANKIKQAWARVRDGLRSKSKRSGKKKSNPTGS